MTSTWGRSRVVALAVLLACTLALAGCNGAVSVGDGTPTESVTPAPVPTATQSLPPGVTAASVDARRLAAAHASVLEGTSYTVVVDHRIRRNDSVISAGTNRRSVGADGRTIRAVRHRERVPFPDQTVAPTVAYWYNGTHLAYRFGSGETARYGRSLLPETGPVHDPTAHERIAAETAAFALEVTGRTDEGWYRLASTGLVDPSRIPTPTAVGNPENGSLTVVVDPSGVVRETRLTYTATFRGAVPVRVVRHTRFLAVGSTTVDRPAWVERALDREEP